MLQRRILSSSLIITALSLCILTGISVTPARAMDTTMTISVFQGWNLVAMPLHPTDGRVSTIFPNAATNAYLFDGVYHDRDTLVHGFGYWIKFDSSETVGISGTLCPGGCTYLKAGWNLTGVPGEAATVDGLFLEPYGKIKFPVYGYDPDSGYITAGSLVPGRAYWINSADSGVLVGEPDGGEWATVSDLVAQWYTRDRWRPDIMYAMSVGALLKTVDRGRTWDTIYSPVIGSGLLIDPVDSNILYLNIQEPYKISPDMNRVKKSTDGGASWFYADAGLPIDYFTRFYIRLIDWSNTDNLVAVSVPYLGVSPAEFHRSTDGGVSWDTVDYGQVENCPWYCEPDIFYLIQNKVNPDVFYIHNNFSDPLYILKSTDQLSTIRWQEFYPLSKYHSIVAHPSQEKTFYSGGRAFYTSTNEGMTWDSSNTGLPVGVDVREIHPLAGSPVIYAICGVDTTWEIYRSDDAGGEWHHVPFGGGDPKYLGVDETNMILYTTSAGVLFKKRLR